MKLNVYSVDSRVCVQLHSIEHQLRSNNSLLLMWSVHSVYFGYRSVDADGTGYSDSRSKTWIHRRCFYCRWVLENYWTKSTKNSTVDPRLYRVLFYAASKILRCAPKVNKCRQYKPFYSEKEFM